jgi:hypothetical protein
MEAATKCITAVASGGKSSSGAGSTNAKVFPRHFLSISAPRGRRTKDSVALLLFIVLMCVKVFMQFL